VEVERERRLLGLSNRPGAWRRPWLAGLNVHANPNALSVPTTALLFGEHGVQVTTVDSTQAVVLKNVQVDEDIGANVEILAGLCL
jgi:hypothetical protein